MAHYQHQIIEYPLNIIPKVEDHQQTTSPHRPGSSLKTSSQVQDHEQNFGYEVPPLANHSYSPESFQAIPQTRQLLQSPNSEPDSGHTSLLTPVKPAQRAFKPPPRKSTSVSPFKLIQSSWPEILSLVLLILVLITIIATLVSHQDRPLPQWPFKITINTLVSTYVTILKSLMLFVIAKGLGQLKWRWFCKTRPLADIGTFDTACRGPLGSMQLLWKLRARQLVASIGALIIVLALLVDPFAQQILRYYDCTISVEDTLAHLPRTNFYDNYGAHIGAGLSDLPTDMKSSINSGLLAPGSIGISFNCPTGNCTFDQDYFTVGYCSSCEDVSKDLSYSCQAVSKEVSTDGQNCTYTLSDMWNNETLSSISVSSVFTPRTFMTVGNTPLTGRVQFLNEFEETKAYLNNESCSEKTWGCMGAVACNLYPCVKGFRAEVRGGNLTEKLISTSTLDSELLTSVDTECLSPNERQSLVAKGYNTSSRWVAYNGGNASQSLLALPYDMRQANASIPSKCLYSLHFLSLNSLYWFLEQYFNGAVVTAGVYTFDTNDNTGPIQLTAMYGSGNISLHSINTSFTGVAEALTTTMRQTGNANYSQPAVGQVSHYATCVHIRWAWLAFPSALVGLTVLFAIGTLVQMSDQGCGYDWKDSQLALLFHGLEGEARDRYGALDRSKEMDKVARRFSVRLERTEKGWRLVEVG